MAFLRFGRDEGYTLAELLVVLALLGLVVGAAFTLLGLVNTGTALSSRQAWMSREIGFPLEHLERLLTQQAPPMNAVGPYVCEIRTDQDRDNHYEIHRFEATIDGRLIQTTSEEVDRPTPQETVWSTNNMNLGVAQPLFVFYDADGKDMSGETEIRIKQYAMSVKVTIAAEHDGEIITDSRHVYFRNR
jgi:prepilin-type N-terminal cleavage/methylation domain-containing protein